MRLTHDDPTLFLPKVARLLAAVSAERNAKSSASDGLRNMTCEAMPTTTTPITTHDWTDDNDHTGVLKNHHRMAMIHHPPARPRADAPTSAHPSTRPRSTTTPSPSRRGHALRP